VLKVGDSCSFGIYFLADKYRYFYGGSEDDGEENSGK
jgi:hypothetical protein